MMKCTAQEIAEKRRQAQERLLNKSLISNVNKVNSNLARHSDTSLASGYNNATASNTNSPLSKPNQNSLKSPSSLWKVNSFYSKPYNKLKPVQNGLSGAKSINGKCVLISENRFAVELSEFSTPAIEIFKTIPSRLFNMKTRNWDFDVRDYDLLQERLVVLQPEVVIGKLPQFVLHCCKIPQPNYFSIDLSRIDNALLSTLLPFQEEGVCFGVDKNGRCLIGDDMGLGKTFQALAIASYYRTDWPLLIATTASMKNEWEATIHKYLPSVSIMHTQYMVAAKDYIDEAEVLIVSHDMMSRALPKLLERRFGILIVDESHNFKNFKAKCTKAAIELTKQAKRVVLLSGTPALSRPSELYTQLALIDDKFFGNFYDFSKRYCDGKQTNFGWDASGKSNLKELEIILAKKFMIRRTKEDVLKALPNKEQEVVTLDVNLNQFSEEDRKCLNSLADNYNRQNKGTEKHAALLTFFSETSKIKIPSVCSYILQTLEQEEKFIVFAHHQKMLDALERILVKKHKKFIRIDGNTSSEQRKYFVDKYQLDDNYVCALLSITAANAGITLTAAKLVIFAELHWNPSILSQAESRAHRIGQENKVLVKYLLAPKTADDSIWPLLQNKQKFLKEVGLFKDSFDNVAVTNHNVTLQDKEHIAECLHLNTTVAGTADISSYFESPQKTVTNGRNSTDNQDSVQTNCEVMASSELDFLNDGFDDIFSNVELNV